MKKDILIDRLTKKVDEEKYGCFHKYYELEIAISDKEELLKDITDQFVDAFVIINPSDGCKDWSEILINWPSFTDDQKKYYKSFFQEGFTKEDGSLDKTNEIGIYGEMLLHLYIKEISKPILHLPKRPKTSVNQQSDAITIEGNINDFDSMYLKVWECKSSDDDNAQSSKVYNQLDRRIRRQNGSIAKMFMVDNDIEESSELGKFLCKLPSIILNKTEQYRCNAFFVFGLMPTGRVLRDFREKVKDLHSPKNRNVYLIYVPNFKDVRLELWRNLKII